MIDVGYAGTIGADRITHGEPIYGEGEFPDDNRFGDTYGPVNYYAYVPFELVLPWDGEWDKLPASHAAAIFFDLATVAGLFVFAVPAIRPWARPRARASCSPSPGSPTRTPTSRCSRTRTTRWSPRLLVWSLALFATPVARGALLGLATMTKFAPIALGPLYAAGHDAGSSSDERRATSGLSDRRLRPVLLFV